MQTELGLLGSNGLHLWAGKMHFVPEMISGLPTHLLRAHWHKGEGVGWHEKAAEIIFF